MMQALFVLFAILYSIHPAVAASFNCKKAVLDVEKSICKSKELSALVLSVGAGLGASASYGLIGSYSGQFPGWQSGVASSLFILAGGVGCVVFPYLIGPIASSAGFRISLATVAVPAVLYGLFSLLIHARATSCSNNLHQIGLAVRQIKQEESNSAAAQL
ncbi:MAG: DUF1559 domain-containing protein, partial [Anaerolineaceae bacterium]|nr:DUF1559 domain-containing protein [Anaerolineaceae bacterium]